MMDWQAELRPRQPPGRATTNATPTSPRYDRDSKDGGIVHGGRARVIDLTRRIHAHAAVPIFFVARFLASCLFPVGIHRWNGQRQTVALAGIRYQTIYLTGIKDILIATKPPDEAEYLPGRYTVAELAKGIDQFYDSPENTLIPVVFGLRVCVMKFNGASQALIDAVLSGMRKQLAEVKYRKGMPI